MNTRPASAGLFLPPKLLLNCSLRPAQPLEKTLSFAAEASRPSLETLKMSNDDDTKLIRTLAPQEFPTTPTNIQFCWRIELGKELEDLIWEKVVGAIFDIALPNNPSVAVVGRPGISATNDTIHVDIFDDSGRRICSLNIEERGAGATRVMWDESR